MLTKILFGLLGIVCVALVQPNPAFAHGSWIINRSHSVINVTNDGEVKVVESIKVDLEDSLKSGYTRQIPLKYSIDNKTWFVEISDIKVQRNSVDEPFIFHKDAEKLTIEIGDSRLELTGEHEYTIRYVLKGALRHGGDADFMYLATTGDWETTVQQATAVVRLPKEVGSTQKCSITPNDNKSSCQSVGLSKTESRFATTDGLRPWSSMFVRAELKSNSIPVTSVSPPSLFYWVEAYKQPLLFLSLLSGSSLLVAGLLWNKSRKASTSTTNQPS